MRVYYGRVAGEPPIAWEFEKEQLPPTAKLIQSDSKTGDSCHFDVVDISNKEAERIAKELPLDYLLLFEGDDNGRFTTQEELESLRLAWEEREKAL